MLELYFAPGACSFVPHVGLEIVRGHDRFDPVLVVETAEAPADALSLEASIRDRQAQLDVAARSPAHALEIASGAPLEG